MPSEEKLKQASMDLSGLVIDFLSSPNPETDQSRLNELRALVEKDPARLVFVLEGYSGFNKGRYEELIEPLIAEFKAGGTPGPAPNENAPDTHQAAPESNAAPASSQPMQPQAAEPPSASPKTDQPDAPLEIAHSSAPQSALEIQRSVLAVEGADNALMNLANAKSELAKAKSEKNEKAAAAAEKAATAALKSVVAAVKADPAGCLKALNDLTDSSSPNSQFYEGTIGPLRSQFEKMAGVAPKPTETAKQKEAQAPAVIKAAPEQLQKITAAQVPGIPNATEPTKKSEADLFKEQFGGPGPVPSVVVEPLAPTGTSERIPTEQDLAKGDDNILAELAMLEKELGMVPGEISGRPPAQPEVSPNAAPTLGSPSAVAELQNIFKGLEAEYGEHGEQQPTAKEPEPAPIKQVPVQGPATPEPGSEVIQIKKAEDAEQAPPSHVVPVSLMEQLPETEEDKALRLSAEADRTKAEEETFEAIEKLTGKPIPRKTVAPPPSLQKPLAETAMGVKERQPKPAAQQSQSPATGAPQINAALDALFGRNQPASDYMAAVKAKAAARQALVDMARGGSQQEVADRLFAEVSAADPATMDSMAKSDSYSKAVLALRDIGYATEAQVSALRAVALKFKHVHRTDIVGNFEEACGIALPALEKKMIRKEGGKAPAGGAAPPANAKMMRMA